MSPVAEGQMPKPTRSERSVSHSAAGVRPTVWKGYSARSESIGLTWVARSDGR